MAHDPNQVREPVQNILEIIRTCRADLRKSDRKVANVVLDDPKLILNDTVAELAARAEVSQPTVLRFCNAIGCSGYPDFKLRLAQSLALGMPATHSVLAGSDTPDQVVEKIFDYTLTSLDWARYHLDKAAIGNAIEMLIAARRIEFFGFGASGIVARDGQQKFPLFGVPCGVEVDFHQQIMQASMLEAGDTCVLISNTGVTRTLMDVARIAKERGAAVLGIVGASDAPLKSYCDVTLVVETLENTSIYTPMTSRIAALVIMDILSTAVALRRDEDQDHQQAFIAMKQRLNEARFN
ncbi:RpiR family transcriptional regulator [Izhakiella australiensis]|uniref:RpiR family transcriptional regulator n=1 Tax=Izhakiella australiensis TaxID=1926881 RepID=A0A1S8YI03_9GAMM|nr:SIS domain-containing protein [Izhakiella australiensis]OON38694.1 RpiR family transcriptional regulator [Izhakiella australiensis]